MYGITDNLIVKGMESSFSLLICCSGALTVYRRQAVQPFIHEWANDEFLRIKNFKFATDRLLTAYILGAKSYDKESRRYYASAVADAFDSYKVSRIGKTCKRKWAWRLLYSPSVTGRVIAQKNFPIIYKTTDQMAKKLSEVSLQQG